jgi:nucleoside 2-deoxyribosyltransferase
MDKKMIVICSSASFYKHVNEIADKLEKMGFAVEVPSTAKRMKKESNYDVTRIKTWYDRPEDAVLKHSLAMEHFDKIAKGDAVLIVNDDKPNKPQYIGPNAMMEWGLAYYLKKPVFLMYGLDREHNAYEEMIGMTTAVLDGDLGKIKL